MTQRAQQVRAHDRRGRILDAALRVFAARGYHAASVDEIAAEAATSKGGVYFHFPGKQALFLALLDWAHHELRRRVDEAVAGPAAPLEKADAALRAVMNAFSGHRRLARIFMIDALGGGKEFHSRVLAIQEEFIALVRALLEEARSAGDVAPDVDPAIAARAWFGAVNSVVLGWLTAKSPASLEQAYRVLRPLIYRSLGAGEPTEVQR
ncbi:Fatty acid metabolism regulator protein [bacterium HR29]|jgi:TetR/AcrR family fatty acid metabolism transcriptional regulator|nr:Fatty acid metabolism regulator protein [bacterium HR29]